MVACARLPPRAVLDHEDRHRARDDPGHRADRAPVVTRLQPNVPVLDEAARGVVVRGPVLVADGAQHGGLHRLAHARPLDRRPRVQHHALRQLERLPGRPAVHQSRLAPDQPGQRLAVGALDRLGALGQPVEHGDQARIAARRWRPRQLDHRHAEPGQLLGEEIEPDADDPWGPAEKLGHRPVAGGAWAVVGVAPGSRARTISMSWRRTRRRSSTSSLDRTSSVKFVPDALGQQDDRPVRARDEGQEQRLRAHGRERTPEVDVDREEASRPGHQHHHPWRDAPRASPAAGSPASGSPTRSAPRRRARAAPPSPPPPREPAGVVVAPATPSTEDRSVRRRRRRAARPSTTGREPPPCHRRARTRGPP